MRRLRNANSRHANSRAGAVGGSASLRALIGSADRDGVWTREDVRPPTGAAWRAGSSDGACTLTLRRTVTTLPGVFESGRIRPPCRRPWRGDASAPRHPGREAGTRLAAIFVAFLLCLARTTPAAGFGLFNPTKHLVLDTRVVAETNLLRLVLGPLEKDPHNPLFQANKPWENALNNLYPNVIYDPEQHLFKLWYKDMLADQEVIQKMVPPRIIAHAGWFLLYATSRYGTVWAKPDLGLIPFDGSTHNNIVARDTANTGVFKDPYDPDPARRYKMVHDEGRGNLRVRFSADGVHWGEAVAPRIEGGVGDTHNNAFYDLRTGKYVLITRLFQGERKVARSESRDFLEWAPPQVVLESLPEEKGHRQTYCMPAFPYANVYLGYLMLINTPGDSTVDCELTWSPDSVRWFRVNPGTPFIPHGPDASYDCGCIYASAGAPIPSNGNLLIYYGGSTARHIGTKRHCLPCLARLRMDGFAGYEPADSATKGTLITRPMLCTGEPLRVSADAWGGAIRVSVLDELGFELDRCAPVRKNVTDREVEWKGNRRFSALRGKFVRLKFELAGARLYAFSGMTLPP
jgi:hypothetical protein